MGSSYPKKVLIRVSLSPDNSKYKKECFLSLFPSSVQIDIPSGILKTWLLTSLETLLNLALIPLLVKKNTHNKTTPTTPTPT